MNSLAKYANYETRYAIRYLLKREHTIGEILRFYAKSIKLKHLELLIEHGLSHDDINYETIIFLKSDDHACLEKLAEIAPLNVLASILLVCGKNKFCDIVQKNIHRFGSEIPLFLLPYLEDITIDNIILRIQHAVIFNRELPDFHGMMVPISILYSINYGNYDILDKLYEKYPNDVEDILWVEECTENIPAKYTRFMSDDYIISIWKKIAKKGLIHNFSSFVDKIIDQKAFCLCYSIELYHLMRAQNTPNATDFYYVISNLGDIVFDDLFADEHFYNEMIVFYPMYLAAAKKSNAEKIIGQIMSTKCIGDSLIRELRSNDLFLIAKCIQMFGDENHFDFDSFGKFAVNHRIPLDAVFNQINCPINFYNEIVEIADCAAVPLIHLSKLRKNTAKIFRWHHRITGIKKYAIRLLALIVLYSDEYVCIDKNAPKKRQFFEIVKKMPFVIQSIIAHRYAWLPNCEPIRLENVDFLRALSVYHA